MSESGLGSAGIWVCGTDTGVGKTVVSTGLVCALEQQGCRVAGFKPLVSGALPRDDIPSPWEDLIRHGLAGGIALQPEQRSLYRLRVPASPAYAAKVEGVVIDRQQLVSGVRQQVAASGVEFAVVEGVGGFRVPLGEGFDTADLAVWLGFPALLVVGLRLGCINHALLTAEALTARGIRLVGWVANLGVDQGYGFIDDTIEVLEEGLGLPCGARLPYVPEAGSLERGIPFPEWELSVREQIQGVAPSLAALAQSLRLAR